jgi:hypothetical protein
MSTGDAQHSVRDAVQTKCEGQRGQLGKEAPELGVSLSLSLSLSQLGKEAPELGVRSACGGQVSRQLGVGSCRGAGLAIRQAHLFHFQGVQRHRQRFLEGPEYAEHLAQQRGRATALRVGFVCVFGRVR